MDESPGAIRQDLEATRLRVGDEVEALSYKTDVGARMDDYVQEKKDAVTSKLGGMKDAVVGTASRAGDAMPDGETLKHRAGTVRDTAERNPMGLALGGAALGFLAGLLLPGTRTENERLGETSDRMKHAAKDVAHEAVDRGKEVAATAMDTVRAEGRHQGSELASTLQDRVQQETGTA